MYMSICGQSKWLSLSQILDVGLMQVQGWGVLKNN